MSALTIYPDDQPQYGEQYTDFSAIQTQLAKIGVKFEQWTSLYELPADADQATVLGAYADSIERLKQQYHFQSVDMMKLNPDHPDKAVFRQKFLAEHIHEDLKYASLSKVVACFVCILTIRYIWSCVSKAI